MALADQVLIKLPPVEDSLNFRDASSRKIIPILGVGAVVAISCHFQLVKYYRQFAEYVDGDRVFFRKDFGYL
jgi:hypothetical protein